MTMTRDEMLVDLNDWYHGWIDGDDPVAHVGIDRSENGVQVMFQSGRIFWITVEDIT
jgi:hypothetical protein